MGVHREKKAPSSQVNEDKKELIVLTLARLFFIATIGVLLQIAHIVFFVVKQQGSLGMQLFWGNW